MSLGIFSECIQNLFPCKYVKKHVFALDSFMCGDKFVFSSVKIKHLIG